MSVSVKKRLWVTGFLAVLTALIFTVPVTGLAAGSSNDVNKDVANQNEDSVFTSTDDVAHAEQLASNAAGQPAPEVIAAMQAEHQAEAALQAAIQSGNSQVIAASQNAHHASEAAAEAVMAAFGGVTPADIAMRGNGMGWGQIAQELGVHPGSLGSGDAKRSFSHNNSQMAQASSRSIRGGQSMMHGVNATNISGSSGMGLDHAAQNYGGWGQFSGATGGHQGGNFGGGHNSGNGSNRGGGWDSDNGAAMGARGSGGGWSSGNGGAIGEHGGSGPDGGMGGDSGSGMGGGSGSGMGGDSGGGPGGGSGGGCR